MHPYVHAQSEADAGIYMINISTFTEDLNFTLNDEIFISGYLQEVAAMAMNKEIQENWSDSYEVTAVHQWLDLMTCLEFKLFFLLMWKHILHCILRLQRNWMEQLLRKHLRRFE